MLHASLAIERLLRSPPVPKGWRYAHRSLHIDQTRHGVAILANPEGLTLPSDIAMEVGENMLRSSPVPKG